ncbi:MAG: zinc-binding dehydrogenase [Bacteroidota bacterium]
MSLARRVWRMPKAGSIGQLRLKDESIPAPGADEVRISVKAIGLNFADIFAMYGLYSATPPGSFVPGLEYAGEVEAVGENVSSVQVGEKIMGVTRFGGYADCLNIDHRYVVPLPATWNFEQGAAFLVQVLTAYYSLFPLGHLQPGQTLLIHSAAGGVGLLANRIAKQKQAFTIGTVGRVEKLDLLKAEGYDQGIVRSRDFARDLKHALAGRELNLVLECIGGRILKESFAALAPMGRLVSYGSAQYAAPGNRPNYLKALWYYLNRPRLDTLSLIEQNKSFMAFNLIHLYEKAHIMHEMLKEIQMLQLAPPHIGHTFTFNNLKAAIRLFQSGKTVGKVVVTVPNETR